MKVKIEPKISRSQLPIQVFMNGSKGIPQVTVHPTTSDIAWVKSFEAPAELIDKENLTYKSEIVLNQTGTYTVTIKDQDTQQSETIQINDQTYLPFFQEIGFFSFLFAMMMAGVILWVRREMNATSKK